MIEGFLVVTKDEINLKKPELLETKVWLDYYISLIKPTT